MEAPTLTSLPSNKEIRQLLEALVGRTTDVRELLGLETRFTTPTIVAGYRDDIGSLRAAVLCDVAFGAYVAAALSVVPPTAAQDCIEGGRLTETLAENVREVL